MATTATGPGAFAPYVFVLMLRNIATYGFQVADHNAPGDPPAPGGYTATGCVLASPSWSVGGFSYPGNVAPIAEDYFFNWTRDAAITMSAVLSQAPAQIPLAAVSELLASYVTFASVCQSSGGVIGQAKYTPEGAQTGAADESDGPALRILTILQGFAGLDQACQAVAQGVLAIDLDYLLAGNRYQQPTVTHWEDTSGQSLFARSVQLRALDKLIAAGPGLGIPVPAGAQAAAAWLGEQLPMHWSAAPANVYVSVIDAERLAGDPAAPYDPSIDPILACIYGDGLSPTDPQLLSTAAQVRAQWSAGGADEYPINGADATAGRGPLIGRYLGDQYDGLSLTSSTGHPWAVCTCAFAQLYYELAAALGNGAAVPNDPLAGMFLDQVGVNAATASPDVSSALRSAGDSMLAAVIYHSNRFELSEQFDQGTGFERSVANLTWSYAAFLTAAAAR
jgi:glucoamylase